MFQLTQIKIFDKNHVTTLVFNATAVLVFCIQR